jgi:hypothetical protein
MTQGISEILTFAIGVAISQNTQVKAERRTATGRQPRQHSGSTSSQRYIKQRQRTMRATHQSPSMA